MFIYIIIDPRYSTVFYVGKTKNYEQRISNHMSSNFRVKMIREAGFKPIFKIIHECTAIESTEIEKHFIRLYHSLGYKLDNHIGVSIVKEKNYELKIMI